jgi:hypothetical protein
MTVTIGILDIHEGFGEETWFINNFSYTKLSDELKDSIKFEKIKSIEDLFILLQLSGLTPDKLIGISDVEYNEFNIYQTIYAQSDNKNTDTDDQQFNKLASQIVRDVNVNGRMIFIKRNIHDESYEDFTFTDFITIIRNVFVRDAIQIDVNCDLRQIEYMNDVLESQNHKDTYDNIRYYEHKILDYTLTFYISKAEEKTDANLNVYASTIYGKKIFGKVVLTLTDHQDEHPRCVNLTEKTLREIYHLYRNHIEIDRSRYTKKFSLDDLNLNEVNRVENQINCFPNITYNPNFFSIISSEYLRYKNMNLLLELKDFPILQID